MSNSQAAAHEAPAQTTVTPPPVAEQPSSQPQQPQQPQQHPMQGNFIPYDQYRASTMPQQPYGQAAYAPAYYAQNQVRPPVEEKKSWVWTKIGLHIASIVFSICGLGLTIAFGVNRYGIGIFVVVVTVPTLGLALLWSIAEVIVRVVRKLKSGIHPGAHVALSLLIWLGTACTGGILATYVALRAYDDDYYDDGSCYRYSSGSGYEDFESESHSPAYGQIVACTVFHLLVFTVHFILFVGACVDTSRRNAHNRAAVVYVQTPAPAWPQQPYPMQQVQPQGQPTDVKGLAMPQQTHVTQGDRGVSGYYAPHQQAPQQAPQEQQQRQPEVREFYAQ